MENGKYGFIYITTNHINNKKYIGQKKYDDANRWKSYLGSGIWLTRAINKYGKENFSKEIIDEAYSKEELDEKEKKWIDYYNATNSKEFYNIARGGDGGFVVAGYSDEEYEKYEEFRKIRINETIPRGEESVNSKLTEFEVNAIICELLDGAYHIDLANKYGVSISTINDIAHHKTWKHLTKDIIFPNVSFHNRSIGKPVAQYDLNMNFIASYDNARRAYELTGISWRLISQVCNGEKKQTHGYVFRFI